MNFRAVLCARSQLLQFVLEFGRGACGGRRIHSRGSPSAILLSLLPKPDQDMSSLTDVDVAGMRKPYYGEQDTFGVDNLSSLDPMKQFAMWFNEACECSKESHVEANAMSLATATKDGRPSVRTVLMKGFDEHGFKFYTNYNSRKGQDIEANPCVSIMFYWEFLKRTVRVEGKAERLSLEESTEYFLSRPRESQMGACASDQSIVIPNKQVLTDKHDELKKQYSDTSIPIPKPDHWGGYLIRPESVEFWQGQTTRLHDRIKFRRLKDGEEADAKLTHQGENGWVYERLAP